MSQVPVYRIGRSEFTTVPIVRSEVVRYGKTDRDVPGPGVSVGRGPGSGRRSATLRWPPAGGDATIY